MPSLNNGFGTQYLGQRDFRPDGSYLTTTFFCLLYLPIFPIRSVRVVPDATKKDISAGFFTKKFFIVLEKRRPDLGQVLSVYACGAAVVALTVFFFAKVDPYLKDQFPDFSGGWKSTVIFALTLSPPLLLAKFLQWGARQRMKAEIRDPNNPTPIG
jgi:hypothetical protein